MTTWQNKIVEAFKENDIRLICHVADTVLAPLIRAFEKDPNMSVVTLAREEEGVGALTGAYLGGTRGALLLQASGFGNTLNALGSLAIPYQIPFPILMSARGGLLEHNVVQLAWGATAPEAAEALGLQVFHLRHDVEVEFIANNAVNHAYVCRRPVVMSIDTTLSGGKYGSS